MVPIKQMLVDTSMYYCKCPYAMTPTRIIVHNTYNDASARNEISYMRSNGKYTSFHVAVDDVEIVQGILFNRNAFSAGDGAYGVGNRQGIAIEICYSMSGGSRFDKAEENAAEYIAALLKEYGWGIDKVTKHQDYMDKYCPHRTLDKGWQRFLNMISKYLKGSTNSKPIYEEPAATIKYGTGIEVCTNTISGSSDGAAGVFTGDWQGTITKVVPGAKYPYLLNNGDIGWTNDKGIDTDPHVPGKQSKPSNTGSKNNLESYSGFVTAKINDLAYHNKPSWSDSTIAGSIDKGTTLTVVGRIKVDGVYMYKTKAGWYITSAKEYVEYSSKKPSGTTSSTIKVGDWVGVRKGAKDYNGGAAAGVVRGKVYYTVDELKGDRAVLDVPGICTPFHVKDLFK